MNKKLTTQQWNETVLAAMSGDETAFEEICRQKTTSILFICNNLLRNWQDAEDATQEVLTTIHEKLDTLNAPESFSVWLNKLSYNTSMTMRRKQMKEQYNTVLSDSENEVQEFAIESLPAELLETKESRQKVMDEIQKLPVNYRMAIIFYYYDGLKAKEIAEVMDTTEKAVENYLHRGRTALKSALGGHSATQKSAAMAAVLLGAVDKTDLPLAAYRSAKLLQVMGIPSSTPGLGAAASTAFFWKAIGTVAISGTIITTTVAVGVGGTQNFVGAPAPPPISSSYNDYGVSTSTLFPVSSGVEALAESAPQPSQPASIPEENMENPASALQGNAVTGTRLMGRVYLYTPNLPDAQTPWSVPGVTIVLVPVSVSGGTEQTTKTMEGVNAGWYLFEDVQPGSYKIKVNLPPSFQVALGGDYTLTDGYLSYKGQTVFALPASLEAHYNLPVVQNGIIQGNVVTNQTALKGKLGGITATLYDSNGTQLMATQTQEDGSYSFVAPPIPAKGEYTIQFTAPNNPELSFSEKQVKVEAQPGATLQASNTTVKDTAPPSLEVVINRGVKGAIANRANAFLVTAKDKYGVNITWTIFKDDSIVQTGQSETPMDLLNNLPSGSYFLQVTATDGNGNSSTFDSILVFS